MHKGYSWILAAAVLTAAFLPGGARAEYPERQITLVVPFSAGGPTDIISRIVAEPMSRALGQNIIIENQVGAGGTVAVTRV
ncbi:MAG: tripartite tricarboxylate transporter substrate binding protein BugD, partial [Pseudolabrys sp.]|nr:tripartite tricarboxylate transporter substrate binding protein BugD [Pseudolabrys sp.]